MEFIGNSHRKMDERPKNCPKEKQNCFSGISNVSWEQKKNNNTCFRMNVNLSGTQWEGPGRQCWKVIQNRVSKRQESALISMAPLTELQLLSSFGGFHRYVCRPETLVNHLDLLDDSLFDTCSALSTVSPLNNDHGSTFNSASEHVTCHS